MSFDAINSHKRSLHYVAKKKKKNMHVSNTSPKVPTYVFNNSCYFFKVSCIVREIGLPRMLKGPHHLPNVMAIVKLVPPKGSCWTATWFLETPTTMLSLSPIK